jgi:CheY-like chemotaxis protein
MENKHYNSLRIPSSHQAGWNQARERSTQSVTSIYPKRRVPQVSADGKGRLVLLVDDNEMVRELIKLQLELLGFQVLCAKDGKEALECYRKRHAEICLVLSDVVMPGQSGWDVLANMRKNKACTPVILASGYYEHPSFPPKSAAQPQAYLHKPFTIKKLEQAIEHALAADTKSAPTVAPFGPKY